MFGMMMSAEEKLQLMGIIIMGDKDAGTNKEGANQEGFAQGVAALMMSLGRIGGACNNGSKPIVGQNW
jgi:hypothetical protein